MMIKGTLSQRQRELKDKLFVEVKDMLARFFETPEYHKRLVKELKEAVASVKNIVQDSGSQGDGNSVPGSLHQLSRLAEGIPLKILWQCWSWRTAASGS